MPLPIIRRVEQRHGTGCAVAAVAMVTGVTYDKAVRAAFGRNKDRNLELDFDQITRAVRRLGLTCRMGADFRVKKLPAILMFEWWSTGDFHCVVWDPAFGGRFVDPGYNRTLGQDFYLEHWRRNGRESLVITGSK